MDGNPEKERFTMMGNFGYGGMSWIGMLLGAIISIGILIGLVLLVVWAVRKTSGNNNLPVSQNLAGLPAKEIAQARYAKGEITRDEYQNILADLGK
jgi:putative membrane protein